MNLGYQRDRAADLLRQAGELRKTINLLQQQYALQQELGDATHQETQSFHDTIAVINDLRDKIANFRRLLPSDPQLLLLGTALLRHPRLLGAEIDFRRD